MSLESETGATRTVARASGPGAYILKLMIACLERGRITIVTPSGQRIDHRSDAPGPEAVLIVHRWRAIRRLLTGGDLAFAEAYIEGDWSSPDLTLLIELAALNLEHIEQVVGGLLPVRLVNRLRHVLKANSKAGSRRNIAFHYDLGNDFYSLWLDPSMTYSSALYRQSGQTLETAQQARLQRVVELLDLGGGKEVLEIGCGWGNLAVVLGRHGARVTGITLSAEQLAHARNLVQKEKLDGTVALELQDYRDTQGTFDRIVSIEMFEAVGEKYWPTYFSILRERLKPGGKAVLQVITIDEKRFESYRSNADFIQRYIFPGGMLPTKTIMTELAKQAHLTLASVDSFGASYALTLAEWRRRFLKAWPMIEAIGFSHNFQRIWEYYLSYCEAGFRVGTIDVGLYVLEKD